LVFYFVLFFFISREIVFNLQFCSGEISATVFLSIDILTSHSFHRTKSLFLFFFTHYVITCRFLHPPVGRPLSLPGRSARSTLPSSLISFSRLQSTISLLLRASLARLRVSTRRSPRKGSRSSRTTMYVTLDGPLSRHSIRCSTGVRFGQIPRTNPISQPGTPGRRARPFLCNL
jgi:hypothetical protein